jgi:hypothetical protein
MRIVIDLFEEMCSISLSGSSSYLKLTGSGTGYSIQIKFSAVVQQTANPLILHYSTLGADPELRILFA